MDRRRRGMIEGMTDDDLVQSDVLCERCKDICSHSQILRDVPKKYTVRNKLTDYIYGESWEDVEETYEYGTWSEIEASCLKGCFLCGFMYYGLFYAHDVSNCQTWNNLLNSSERFQLNITANEPSRECRIRFKGFSSPTARVFIDGDERMPPAAKFSTAQLAISTKSSSTFDLARTWLKDCKMNHDLCEDRATTCRTAPFFRHSRNFVPSRLIDVSAGQTRLVVTLGKDIRDEYLALSHCWGEKKILRLLTTNIDDMIKGIDGAELSQTFQDALFITRTLGYRYIWIDSLCIIQDSGADWRIQADLMAQVYGSADCTIAAIGADGSAGCFKRRNPLLRRPGKLTQSGDTPIFGYGFLGLGEHHVLESEPGIPGLKNLPLLLRAWVVQERLISNRILYYGYQGLIWECSTCTASEFRPQIFPVPVFKYAEEPLKFALRRLLRENGQSGQAWKQAFLEIWNRIVKIYTMTSLTHLTDRVAALAGIAEMIEFSTGMEYIAGLWAQMLPEVLMWSPAEPQQKISFPSWSWLTWGERVTSLETHPPPNVIEAVTVYLGGGEVRSIIKPNNSVLGEVTKGELVVKGIMQKVYFPVDDETGEVVAENLVYTRPTRISRNVSNHRGLKDPIGHTYIPSLAPEANFDLHFLLLKRIQYKIEHRPARTAQQTYQPEIEERGLVVIPYADEKGWIRVGRFSRIYSIPWSGESWELLFPGAEGVKEDEISISLF